MSRLRLLPLLLLSASACNSIITYTPLPPDERYGTRIIEYSPLQPTNWFFEHHGNAVTAVGYQREGWAVDYTQTEPSWKALHVSLPDYRATDLPPPPLKRPRRFRMAVPIGAADVDAVLTDSELAIRDGQQWALHTFPTELEADISFLAIAGPKTLLMQTQRRGVWVLRNEAWEQLATDLGDHTYLVAVDGDRVRLVSGQPVDPATQQPVGHATLALVSFATGQRLTADVVPAERFTGLVMAGLNGTVDDFTLFLGEKGPRYFDAVRTTHFTSGRFERQGRNAVPFDNGFSSIVPTPGSAVVLFQANLKPELINLWQPCSCDVTNDEACLCRDRPVKKLVLVAPTATGAEAIVIATEEARTHVALRTVDLTAPVDSQWLVSPSACSPQCLSPLVCQSQSGEYACAMPLPVIDAGTTDLPVTLTAHLVVPPGVDAGAVDIITERLTTFGPYPDFDVVSYGPDVRVQVEANVGGQLTFSEPTSGINAFKTWPPSPAGTTIDLGPISFNTPLTAHPFAQGTLDLQDLYVDAAGSLLMARVGGQVVYLANKPGGFEFRSTGVSAPLSTHLFPIGGSALLESAAGLTLVPNGLSDGGAAGVINPPNSHLDVSTLVIASWGGSFTLHDVNASGTQQHPAWWFTGSAPRALTQPGESEALSPDGFTLVRREGNDLVRRSTDLSSRTVFISDLSGPAAFLVPNDGSGVPTRPLVVIAEGATPKACLAGTGTASCSVRLRPSGGSFTISVSAAAKFIAMDRRGTALLMDEGAGLTRYLLASGTRAPLALPAGLVPTEVVQIGDVSEIFAEDGRVVLFDLVNGTVMRTLPAKARRKRGSSGIIIQADGCGTGEPCAVQAYRPDRDELTDFGAGSARRTILNTRDMVSLQNDALEVLSLMPGIAPRLMVRSGYRTAFLPGFDDALTTFGTPCAFFTADTAFGASTRFTGCAY